MFGLIKILKAELEIKVRNDLGIKQKLLQGGSFRIRTKFKSGF